MPRPTLSPECKSFCLYDVVLTQTTKEELVAYYTREFETFRSISGRVNHKKDSFINQYWDYNPYLGCSWKGHRSPSRIDYDWAGGDEDLMDQSIWLGRYKRDLVLLIRVFSLEGDYQSMLYDVEKAVSQSLEYDAEFTALDSRNYTVAYNAWKETHKSYLEEEAMMDKHRRGTHTLLYWQSNLKEGAEAFFEEHIKPQVERCKACACERQAEIDRAEYKQIQAEELRRPTEDPVPIPPMERTIHKCEICSFETPHRLIFQRHNESRDHQSNVRRAKWWCADCGVQSRTQLEHDHHCASRKHRQAIGEIAKEPDSFRCECCDFTTPHKHVYQRHCASNTHKEKVLVVIREA